MDVSFYISELLTKHGEISVPGLGYLVKAYVAGYYNETDGKFYPPHYLIQFDPQTLDDDDTLTQYIADVKNISLESSKYFTEKFITDIRENALVKEVPVADLGWFYTEQGRLLFKPALAIHNDPAFFGYTPVSLRRLGEGPVQSTAAPVPTPNPEPAINIPPLQDFGRPTPPPVYNFTAETPVPTPEADMPAEQPPVNENSKKQALIDEFNARNKAAFAEEMAAAAKPLYPPLAEQQYTAPEEEQYEEEEERSRPWGLIIAFGVILFLALAFLGVYKFAPTRYQAVKEWFQKKTSKAPATSDTTKVVKPTETQVVLPPKIDSATADSIKQARFADSLKLIKVADSTAKAKIINDKKTAATRRADSIKKVNDDIATAKAKKIADKKAADTRKADSIKKVNDDKIAARIQKAADKKLADARKADSIKQVRAAAKAAKTSKVVATQPIAAPIKQAPPVVIPEKKTKLVVDAPVKQKAAPTLTQPKAAPGTPDPLKIIAPEPGKSWITIAKDCTNAADALATINKLKLIGIDGFRIRSKNGRIRIATRAYDSNDEADAAKKDLQAKGFTEAFLAPIN